MLERPVPQPTHPDGGMNRLRGQRGPATGAVVRAVMNVKHVDQHDRHQIQHRVRQRSKHEQRLKHVLAQSPNRLQAVEPQSERGKHRTCGLARRIGRETYPLHQSFPRSFSRIGNATGPHRAVAGSVVRAVVDMKQLGQHDHHQTQR